MQNTIVAVYDSFDHARDAMTALLDNGFEHGQVQLNPRADATGVRRASSVSEQTDEQGGTHESGISHFFRSLFGMKHEHEDMYAEAIRRGSSVLTVLAGTDRRRDDALAILMRFHPIDLDQRVEHWRREGWAGYTDHHMPAGQASAGTGPSTSAAAARNRQETPQMHRNTEVPPAGNVHEGEEGFPKYGPLRVYAGTSTEAVAGGAGPARRNSDLDDTLTAADDADYRAHWRNVYGVDSGRYEDFDAAYRYGAMAPVRKGMQDARWEDAEPQLRGDWEAQHPGRPWDRVREAVRYGAEKVLGRERR